jgi:hypothetical protein
MRRYGSAMIKDGSGRKIRAALVGDLSVEELNDIENAWWQAQKTFTAELKAAGVDPCEWKRFEWYWRWSELPQQFGPDAIIRGVDYGKVTEGLIAVLPDQPCHLPDQEGERLVEIHMLMSAPWNRGEDLKLIGRTPQFFGVGKALMRFAVRESIRRGFGGRVGAVPEESSYDFYEEVCGMQLMTILRKGVPTDWYEMTPTTARRLLYGRGLRSKSKS